jgi:hypothetical protein
MMIDFDLKSQAPAAACSLTSVSCVNGTHACKLFCKRQRNYTVDERRDCEVLNRACHVVCEPKRDATAGIAYSVQPFNQQD